MCGIVGFLDKTHNAHAAVGSVLCAMLRALGCRGPDSAGVALYGSGQAGDLVLQIKLGEGGDFEVKSQEIVARVQHLGTLRDCTRTAAYLRLVLSYTGDPQQVERLIEADDNQVEVVSMGRHLEIVKQVGSPQSLDATYGVSKWTGTHGLGHTRLSTESRIDLSHSQPFWAHGYPDLAIVHNGHITNYDTMRRRYEQRGVRLYTHNDSEIIGVYLAERLSRGNTLGEALQASLTDFDGSFSYLAATPQALGFAKDPFALKPLLVTETETFVAVATEEMAIRAACEGTYTVREAQAKEVRVWQR
ncbi:MAG TPA: glutamine phosphoribosylpyrophosphate amidotransferase [Candidatus Tectomicrobia bacterium]